MICRVRETEKIKKFLTKSKTFGIIQKLSEMNKQFEQLRNIDN